MSKSTKDKRVKATIILFAQNDIDSISVQKIGVMKNKLWVNIYQKSLIHLKPTLKLKAVTNNVLLSS